MSEDAHELYNPNPEASDDIYRRDLLRQFGFIKSRVENSDDHTFDKEVLLPEQASEPGKRLKLSFWVSDETEKEDQVTNHYKLSEIEITSPRIGRILAEGYRTMHGNGATDESLETHSSNPEELFIRFNVALVGSDFKQVMK